MDFPTTLLVSLIRVASQKAQLFHNASVQAVDIDAIAAYAKEWGTDGWEGYGRVLPITFDNGRFAHVGASDNGNNRKHI